MLRKLRIAYFAHSLRSDWNNGNAHFLRGLLHQLSVLGHDVTAYEPANNWSMVNLRDEAEGQASLLEFDRTYPQLRIVPYTLGPDRGSSLQGPKLKDTDVVILHEWNSPELAQRLLAQREIHGFKLLFHDTHHRASSSPAQIRLFGLDHFDGILAFGEALRTIYREKFGSKRVWTLHEAADTDVFYPRSATSKVNDVVWIGNWGEDERTAEIQEYLLCPAARLPGTRFVIYGVRYPQAGLQALQKAGVEYGGYLPNLQAPAIYATSKLTVHIPRQQYSQAGTSTPGTAMTGIPTIRVFEALACGIPLISAPWTDTEHLFREGDFCLAHSEEQMRTAIEGLLQDPEAAALQAQRGLETVRNRHTCRHRAEELTGFCEELLQ